MWCSYGSSTVLILCPDLQSPSFPWVQHQETFQQVLTVSRHVEGDTVFTPQHTLSQLLHTQTHADKTHADKTHADRHT